MIKGNHKNKEVLLLNYVYNAMNGINIKLPKCKYLYKKSNHSQRSKIMILLTAIFATVTMVGGLMFEGVNTTLNYKKKNYGESYFSTSSKG